MHTPKKFSGWKLAALLMLPALQACSTTYAPPPPSTPKLQATPMLQATPLPAEILQINTSSSQPTLHKARAWLESLSIWSSSATPKSTP